MQKERPLSPHLQVYKPQMTSMLSIMHRGTGVFLAMGTPLLVFWLVKLAAGPVAFEQAQQFFGNWFVQLMLMGWTFSVFYHLCNGIRHLFWDVGQGYEMESLYKSGYAVIFVASALTAFVLVSVYLGGA